MYESRYYIKVIVFTVRDESDQIAILIQSSRNVVGRHAIISNSITSGLGRKESLNRT